jgi:hypothetical protein
MTLPTLDSKTIAEFLTANPALDLEKFDFFDKEKVDFLVWGEQDPAALLPKLKALQRLIRLTGNLETAEALYEQGLHAAVQIALIPAHQFVKKYAPLFTANALSSQEQARQVHQRALARKSKAVFTYTAITQQRAPHYRATRFDNLSALTESNYNNLPSYQDLFGDLDFCDCPDCRSIFSPAAYFLDLMRLQAKYLSTDSTAQPLQTRRPDLWNIPLDCDHTNTLIPRLQIVNQVLLQASGVTYDQLLTTNYPFNLPVNLSLTHTQLYLKASGQTLADIWRTLLPMATAEDLASVARQSLGLSPQQWTLYSTSQTTATALAPLYGLTAEQDPITVLTPVDTFLTQTGLSYKELQILLNEDLSEAEVQSQLNKAFFINIGAPDMPSIDISTDGSNLTNLTLDRLDHIHRLIRLAQALGWSFTDLDWTLRTIGSIINTANQGLPVISDDVLPYLAWIYTLQQENQLSVNQACALLGTLKDFGQKNGPGTDFFNQVFNNPNIPNPPAWRDSNGVYSLTWNVPNGPAYTPTDLDTQIQNALGAVLKLSQDNMLLIANQMLSALGLTSNALPLTLANLSILYRLSQLSVVTGLSIQECFVALNLLDKTTGLNHLAGSSSSAVYNAFVLLQQFAQWLKHTPFSVYQLQFILTGESQNPSIQNQVLGADQIANFLNELEATIQPTLLTQDQLTTALFPTLQAAFGDQAEGLGGLIYPRLQSAKPAYIDQQGVVTPTGNSATVKQIKNILPAPANIDQIAALIVNILQNNYQLQQNTLIQQLAGLYNISPNLVPALEQWGSLTLEADQDTGAEKAVPLLQHVLSKSITRWDKATVLAAENQDLVSRLALLQQYAVLLTTLALSAAEVQAMLDSPAYFGLNYDSAGNPNFSLANVQTLYQFKQLIIEFQDTQNHLLDYFTIASQTTDPQTIAQQLAQVTQWDASQIQFLIQTLWTSHTTYPWATVAGVSQLQAYFDIAQQLYIDISTLYQLTETINTAQDGTIQQALAAALWAGLQQAYQDQPARLAALQSSVDEIQRSALLELVIYRVRTSKGLPIITARDLSEYLLIDVEVSGVVQTSYIQEAISCVQLYVHRCMNHLETGVEVQGELHRWWAWMNQYRVWEANREVFLYPENYLQPELRSGKTPQFIHLENDLQQSKLTSEVIDRAVKAYIDGFAEVATLTIVGSYVYANDDASQVLYLVGRTTVKSYTYYYRSATLIMNTDGSVASASWTPWIQIDLQIKSSLASPVYAFDRLFLFWVEAKPGPSDVDSTTGRPNGRRFETTVYYAFYDFNKQWSAPQQLINSILLPNTINTQADAEAAVWQQINTLFIPTSQLIYWSWGSVADGCFWAGTLNEQLDYTLFPLPVYSKAQIAGSPSVVEFDGDLYCLYRSNIDAKSLQCIVYSARNNTWQPPTNQTLYLAGSPSGIVYQNTLWCFSNQGTFNNDSLYQIECSQYQDGAFNVRQKQMNASIFGNPSAVVYNNLMYCFYQGSYGANFTENLWYATSPDGTTWTNTQVLPNTTTSIAGSPSAVVYQNTLYCFYGGTDSAPPSAFYYVTSKDGTNWQNPGKALNHLYSSNPSAVVYQGILYCFGVGGKAGSSDNRLYYEFSNDGGTTWQGPVLVPDIEIYSDPCAVVYQDRLYCFYQDANNMLCGTIISDLPNNALSFLNIAVKPTSLPANVVPGLALTWSIDTGPDSTQFLTIPASNAKQEIRLTSPVVYKLSRILFSQGLNTFLSLATQETPEVNIDGSKTATLDFISANALYYWELFFHMPFLVAHSFSTQQQFELAKSWYEYIFNPTIPQKDWNLLTDEAVNDKYWRFLQLRSFYNPTLQTELNESWAQEVQVDLQANSQLAAYHNDPFDPHAIAALRPIAYQKALVMHYIDNLLDWADNLFRQYTNETIVEATMLYIMVYDLLGKQPVSLGTCALPASESISQIMTVTGDSLADIPEFLINVEQKQGSVVTVNATDNPNNYIPNDYFGLPENSQFISYWNKVARRLFNIRHGLNIDGVYNQLALFQPPIDPMQLVAAIAAGQGIQSALIGSQVEIPYYRFSAMVGQAQAVTQTVIQLGQGLLSVLERQDAEQLALLYSSNQQILLALTRTSKEDQLEAATQTLASLQVSLQNAQIRLGYYTQLLNDGLLSGEEAQLVLERTAIYTQTNAQAIKGVSIAGFLIPTVFGLADGDFKPGDAILQGAHILEGVSNALSLSAGLAGTVAAYQRRAQDWQLQQSLAQADVEQIQYQILAAQYQQNMASEDIKLLEKQIEQEQAVETFLKNKFTRVQLYQWMVGKIATLYFQAYQLAYNQALQAEKAWQFERGKVQTFISPTYWNDLYHGLVAGEALQFDLQRMQKAYMDQNIRKLEIVKTISLAQLDPRALYNLKTTGSCTFDLTEKDFAYDYRGHYCRQIKTLSLSFPALTGPYQNLYATLVQTGNKTLLQADTEGVKYLLGATTTQPDSSVLRIDMRANQQVALSQGLNDSGLFVLSFEDERYLPFEGTGAISSWRLDMPKDSNPINFDNLTDVIIQMQYTALPGNEEFTKTVRQNIGNFNGFQSLVMAQAASAWHAFINQGRSLPFIVGPTLFRANLTSYTVTDITIIVLPTAAGQGIIEMPTLNITSSNPSINLAFNLAKDSAGLIMASQTGQKLSIDQAATWNLDITSDPGKLMSPNNVNNMIIILEYTAQF